MTQSDFKQVQKIMDQIKNIEKEIDLIPLRRHIVRYGKKLLGKNTPGINDSYLFYLTDEDVKLLIEARKEMIGLLKGKLALFGINVS